MDETPISLENILEQAPKWTFAGDFTLLQWMNQISQDLEIRATKTTEALSKLNNNIRSTNVALDNVANSLTALQFGNQFVECRVQDDDETIMNTNDATTSSDNRNQTEHILSSKEMLDTFLENNLKVLRNCHEKYSIDLDDSDEEDDGKSKEKTCIYQPINPYNEKPLPYIFGSKDWHAKWHVGLYENQEENSYSGDEISEAFSESSSTSHVDDNESFESNTEWASSYSIDNDNINTNIEVKNASSLRGSQSIYPGTKAIPINANKNKVPISESSSLSTPSSSSLAKKAMHSTKPNQILTHKTESINSLNSKISTNPIVSENKDILTTKVPTQKYVDLFTEPPEDVQSTTSSTASSSTHNRIPAQHTKQSVATERPSTFRSQPTTPYVDLFAEPPEDIPSSTTSSISSAGQYIKRKTVNLFDDDDEEDDIVKNDLLSAITKKEDLEQTKNVEKVKLPSNKSVVLDKPLTTAKTSKSLFEDSEDDDDDFLKAFVKKSSVKDTNKTSLAKSLIFDNDISDNTVIKPVKETKEDVIDKNLPNKKLNIFNETDENENDFLFSKDKSKKEDTSKLENATEVNKNISTKPPIENIKKTVNIFDDIDYDFKPQSLQPKDKPKKINLFDDLDDDEGDDIFAIKTKPIIKQKTDVKDTITENITKEDLSNEIENVEKNEVKNNGSKEKDFKDPSRKTFANIDQKNENKQVTNEVNTLAEPSVKSLSTASKKDIDFTESLGKIEQKIDHKHDNNKGIEQKQEELSHTIEKVNKPEETLNQVELPVEKSSNLKPKLTENKEILKNNNVPLNEAKVEAPNETNLENAEIVKSIDNLKEQKEFSKNDTLANKQTIPISTNEKQKPITNKYDFNSILFLDEPPEDDNEFFETLAKTPQTLNTNYNTIDLEHDLYEPELPKVPASNGNNKPPDVMENKQTNMYTGLQLFSDIPPEDDGDIDDNEGNNNAKDNNQTKRLHSVFYDDFNETLKALHKNQIDNELPKHSIFNDQPPPINEELSSLSDDIIDHKVPELKAEDIGKEDFKNKTSEIVSKLEETQNKLDNKTDILPTSKRSVSKLQMPQININVQALLPGANNTLRKVKDDISTPTSIKDVTTNTNISAMPASVEKQAFTVEKPIEEVKRTAETEHILPSVTKNRIKGPARRPSTRRARQENYRKSMLEEEQQPMESDDEIKSLQKINANQIKSLTNIPKNIEKPADKITKPVISQEQIKDKPNGGNHMNPLSSILFEDKTQDDLDIFSVTKKPNKTITEQIPDKVEQIQNVDNSKEQGIITKTVTNKSSLLFEDDDDEEDDDLFKHIKTSKINENKSNKDEDKTKVINTSLDNTKQDVTKEIPVVDMVIPKLDTKPQQTLKTDDNLLNKNLDIETPQTAVNEANKKINKSKASFLDEEEDDDNDLFKTTTQKPNITNVSNRSNLKAKTQLKSFLDSESDDDTQVAGLPTTSSVKSEIINKTVTSDPKATEHTNTKTKLFNDSDTDSDDLFGKLSTDKTKNQRSSTVASNVSSNITKIHNKPQPQSSLFSDESDDEDFLKPASKVIKTPATKSNLQENKSKISNQTNANQSLFSDIDSDEDDLFGGGGAVAKGTTPKAANIPTIKIPTITKPSVAAPSAEVVKPKTVTADNPLADLL